MIVSIIILLILVGLFFLANRKGKSVPECFERPRRKRNGEKKQDRGNLKDRWKQERLVPIRIGMTGLYIEEWIRLFSRKNREEEDALLIPEKERICTAANMFGFAWCIAVSGCCIGLAMGILQLTGKQISYVRRPDFGSVRTESVWVDGLSEGEEVRIRISGRDPDEKEIESVFDAAFQKLSTEISGENRDLNTISKNMDFVSETEEGITVEYESNNREILSNYGIVLQENIPEEGIGVTITVKLSYKEHQKEYELPVRLVPPENQLSELEKLEAEIAQRDLETKKEKELILPDSLEGKAITYEKKNISAGSIPALFLLAAALIVAGVFSKRRTAMKKREEELTVSYSKVLMKFSALLDAGMSTRMAWLKLADDYRRDRDRDKVRREYAMEEMVITANRLRSGIPEESAYSEFGRRIGQHRYMKFANILSLSLRQGISGMKGVLKSETQQALEERKNFALKKGEEAGTKQLFPMLMMLGIVIVVLIVPAFMSL